MGACLRAQWWCLPVAAAGLATVSRFRSAPRRRPMLARRRRALSRPTRLPAAARAAEGEGGLRGRLVEGWRGRGALASGRSRAATDAKKQSMSTCAMVRSAEGARAGRGGGGGIASTRLSNRVFHEPMKWRRDALKKSRTNVEFSRDDWRGPSSWGMPRRASAAARCASSRRRAASSSAQVFDAPAGAGAAISQSVPPLRSENHRDIS